MGATATAPELVAAFEAAINDKNADALGSIFTPDAIFVNIMGMRMLGRQGIIDGHAWAFNGPLKASNVTFDDIEERAVADGVAVIHARCHRTRPPDAPDGGLPPGSTVLVLTARQDQDGWCAVAAVNVAETPAPPPR